MVDGVAWLDVMGAEQTDFYSDRGSAPVGRNTSYHVAPSQRMVFFEADVH